MQFFYIMKVVIYKRVHILFISIIFEAKTVILPFFISLTLVVSCHFGFWPLGRVRFEVTFNLIRPVLSF